MKPKQRIQKKSRQWRSPQVTLSVNVEKIRDFFNEQTKVNENKIIVKWFLIGFIACDFITDIVNGILN